MQQNDTVIVMYMKGDPMDAQASLKSMFILDLDLFET